MPTWWVIGCSFTRDSTTGNDTGRCFRPLTEMLAKLYLGSARTSLIYKEVKRLRADNTGEVGKNVVKPLYPEDHWNRPSTIEGGGAEGCPPGLIKVRIRYYPTITICAIVQN